MTLGANDMYIYKRVYKTLNSAFAPSFAIFKIFNLIASILLNPLYTYYLNTTIINKNFDYQLFTLGEKVIINAENIGLRKEVNRFEKLTQVEPKTLTTLKAIKNVSLLRFILCRRKNRTKAFYEQAKYVIYTYLSIENLFSCLVDYHRLKTYLFAKDNDLKRYLGYDDKRLILNNMKNKEELKLEVLINKLDTTLISNISKD
jgi:hypothetical protein